MEANGDLTFGATTLEIEAGLILLLRVDEAIEGLVLLMIVVTNFGLVLALIDITGIGGSRFEVLAILDVVFVNCRLVTGGAQAVRD